MTLDDLDEPSPARQRLAKALRGLRVAAGLTGEQLAERVGLSQPKVSRIENARQAVQLRDVEAWLRTVDAPSEARAEVNELAEAVLTESSDLRRELRGGRRRKQERIGRLEAAASTMRVWQPGLIPGLLQTAEYARHVFGFAREAPWDLAEAVKARMDRQAVLFDQSKRLFFLIGEGGLRRRLGPPEVLLGQLDRLMSLIGLPTVEIGLVPFDAEARELDFHAYWIYGDAEDDVVVNVKILTDELNIREAGKVARYLDHFERMRAGALFDADARALLAKVGNDLREVST